MNKVVKGILIIIPIILSGFLAFNIYEYSNTKMENNNIKKKLKENEKITTKLNTEKEEINNNLNSLKEEKKDKIIEYEKWQKWEEELKEKLN